jgi:hypothetical protein
MKNTRENAHSSSDRARDLRVELAHKIAFFVGLEENRATEIPELSLHRRTAVTAPDEIIGLGLHGEGA